MAHILVSKALGCYRLLRRGNTSYLNLCWNSNYTSNSGIKSCPSAFGTISSRPTRTVWLKKQVNFQQFRCMATKELNLTDVESRVMENLRLYDKIDQEKLTKTSNFMKDLGLDSLDHVEIIMSIENEFGEAVPDDEAEKLLTPQDIINWVAKRLID